MSADRNNTVPVGRLYGFLLIILLCLTLLGGFGFLGIKYVEYESKWKHGLLPGKHFAPDQHGEDPERVLRSDVLVNHHADDAVGILDGSIAAVVTALDLVDVVHALDDLAKRRKPAAGFPSSVSLIGSI